MPKIDCALSFFFRPEAALWTLASEKVVKPRLGQVGNGASVIASAEVDLSRFLPMLDHQLVGRDYVLGKLSIVDFAVAPWLEAAPRLGVDPGAYENIGSWLARLSTGVHGLDEAAKK